MSAIAGGPTYSAAIAAVATAPSNTAAQAVHMSAHTSTVTKPAPLLQSLTGGAASSTNSPQHVQQQQQGPSAQQPQQAAEQVCLTLKNVLLPPERLDPDNSPSRQDGLSYSDEWNLRYMGCELIQSASILLKLPHVACATGQVLYQRFYYSRSLVRHHYEHMAMACIFLAAKIEEAPRRARDVINVFHHIRQFREKRPFTPLPLDNNYVNLKNQVIKAERRLLKELGFSVHVQHPHKLIPVWLNWLQLDDNQQLRQSAWNYMNDSFRTHVFCQYSPEQVACGCILLSARKLRVPLPDDWMELLDCSFDQAVDICHTLLSLYARPPIDWSAAEAAVVEAKKRMDQAKAVAKSGGSSGQQQRNSGPESASGTPRVDSPAVAPSSTTSGAVKAPDSKPEQQQQERLSSSSLKKKKKKFRRRDDFEDGDDKLAGQNAASDAASSDNDDYNEAGSRSRSRSRSFSRDRRRRHRRRGDDRDRDRDRDSAARERHHRSSRRHHRDRDRSNGGAGVPAAYSKRRR